MPLLKKYEILCSFSVGSSEKIVGLSVGYSVGNTGFSVGCPVGDTVESRSFVKFLFLHKLQLLKNAGQYPCRKWDRRVGRAARGTF